MNRNQMEFILLNLVLAVITSFIAVYIAITRHYRRARFIMVLITGASIWAYGYAMEMYFTTYSSKLFWAYVQILGMSLLGVWPMLMVHLTGNEEYSGRKGALLFSLVPVITLVLAVTNDMHGLIFENVSMNYLDLQFPLLKTFGLWYNFFAIYGYTVILGSSIYASSFYVRNKPELKLNMNRVIIFIFVPILFNVYSQFSTRTVYYDYTPMITCINSIVLLILAPSEFRIGDIMPLEYANILGQMEDVVILVDQNDQIIHVNPAARRGINHELGVPEDDIEGRTLTSFFKLVEVVGSVEAPTEIIVNEKCFDLSFFPINDWRGNPGTTCCILREVTERRNLEDKLRVLHYYASSIAKATSFEDVGEITENALKSSLGFSNGVLILTNPSGYSLVQSWGLAEANLTSDHLQRLSLIDKPQRCCVGEFFADIDCSGKEECSEMAMLSVPIIDNLRHRGVICIFREPNFLFNENQSRLLEIFGNHIASAVHSIENEQAMKSVQREEIKQILQGAGRVSNMVRHDLRSPLQTIKNAAFILQKDPSNEKMLPIINESIEYMVKIIEDLVYTENVSNLHLRDLNLNTLIQQSLNQMLKPASITIETDLYNAPLEGQFDKIKIQRMLDNLFKNAIEAMPNGGTLSISSTRAQSELILSICDTGMGIENIDKLFTPFHTTKLNGMGLGLISVKQTVDAHNGSVSVESTPGEGTCFTISFPVDPDYTANNTTILNTITAK